MLTLLSYLWRLCGPNFSSGWKEWVHKNLVKDKPFWHMRIPSISSWSWKKLLQLRPLVQQFVRVKIGDGCSTKLWDDHWPLLGPTSTRVNARTISNTGISRISLVKDLCNNESFVWPENEVLSTINSLETPTITSSKDCLLWNNKGEFSVKRVWEDTRSRGDLVNWGHWVWKEPCSFLLWLAVKNKPTTMDVQKRREYNIANSVSFARSMRRRLITCSSTAIYHNRFG